MTEESYRIRLVTLGGVSVGKSAILKRFLFNTFNEKHKPTVEDLFTKDFNLGTMTLKVDFLDTEGDMQFPAMRRLSIANAQAFMLVYSIDKSSTFDIIKTCFEEIKEVRTDFQEIPIIFVGNKCDLSDEFKEVPKEDMAEWVFCELPKLRTKVMECSAKNNTNVKEIFNAFLHLARIPLPNDEGLRRRSSAQARVQNGKSRFAGNTSLTPNHAIPDDETGQRLKPRSRSLIRRSSKKVNKSREPTSDADDCAIS
ncbi:ras-related protein Rap-1b-like [Oppia nitens]|uniref:ras-related protein Rap-1b-like n=1 Tax=Oppia nitens TaxID=1686743 RepID=UPI0023D9F77E|nr:ras-related protein Rap-1b-like [Oppia nitens]